MPLTKNEFESFLKKPRLAHLATSSSKGKPRVTPMWFAYDHGIFYFTTRLHRVKGQHMKRNPFMALSIATDEQPYQAVCAFGKVEIVNESRNDWLKKISFRYGEKEGRAWFESAIKQPDRVVLALKPERILSWHYGRDDSSRQDEGESMATTIS
ncbi:MAG TPA: TIGR03618 family F420-dependent PPOX class oxidoreductase [Terriglobales bacterium]|nr:TIGR03618 family F420-dependent PPOX class oxidoreductase [Terriglobales bacterium]